MVISSLAGGALARPQTACSFHQRLAVPTEGSADRVELGAGQPPPNSPKPTEGSAGFGDSLFPTMGNGGYDAEHYTIEMQVKDNRKLRAHTTMQARATQDLSTFNLDFRGFDISKVTVNGRSAGFSREGGELTVTPEGTLPAGQPFEVSVDYAGTARGYNSPHAPVKLGWNAFRNGAYVVSQPDGAPSWYPVNDHPQDKASYTFKITVDDPLVAVANGNLTDVSHGQGTTTYTWEARDPMASYLATVHVGDYVERKDVGPGDLPIRHYFPRDIADTANYDFGRTAEMLDYYGKLFGTYPFETYGAVVMDTQIGGAALETQTLPLFERGMVTGDRSNEEIYVHELAHQWFGDSISLKDWKDIWINEGAATYAQWLWTEKNEGHAALEDRAKRTHAYLKTWGVDSLEPAARRPIGEPTATNLFDHRIYMQGALTLHALRHTVGDEAFFKTMQTFAEEFRNKSAGSEDFQAVAERVSGQNLGDFFQAWLHRTTVPDLPPDPTPGQGSSKSA